MKSQRQADEDFIHQSQSQSKLKRKGQVVMTCSECGLQGHDKRYHLRPDTPSHMNEWYNAPLHPVGNDMETPIGTKTKFMPIPGVDMRGIQEGPAATSIDVEGGNEKETATTTDIRMEEINISPMVEELQRLMMKKQLQEDLPEPMREGIITQDYLVLYLRDPDKVSICVWE
ncbi:hypothetical protein Adt_12252 [Abeliophyllum distichum]|uniref:Uncharacterized protein n=1 Tax=Abeliophyllum distichum TaxID=126358 RepID=A0ABD1UR61_9LAMI